MMTTGLTLETLFFHLWFEFSYGALSQEIAEYQFGQAVHHLPD